MWNNFEQSVQEDETISNAFASRGIFKISSDEQVEHYPKVQASVHEKKMVIAIDKSLFLLENDLMVKCSFLSFNAEIDVVALSDSGNLIVCGLSDGEIHGIFIKGVPVFNLSIKSDDVRISGRTFIGIQLIHNQFFLVCTNGSVYQLSEIDETPLTNNMNVTLNENESIAISEGLMNNIVMKQYLPPKRYVSELTTVALISQYDESANILYIGATNNAIYFRNNEHLNKADVPDCYQGIKQIYNLEHFILALTNSGHLFEICPFTQMLMIIDINEEQRIDDIIIMDCNDDNIELLVLSKKLETHERYMRIIDYPSLKCNSELEISPNSWLVRQPKCSVNLYYLTGENINSQNIPTVIEMKLVSETHPSERFKKLVAKGHLEEAEDFGIQFELSLQPIYEAKAKRILINLCSSPSDNNEHNFNKQFEELSKLMDKIENRSFFKNNRMISLPKRELLAKFLQEILKHLKEEVDDNDIVEIVEQQHRLETLAIIDPYECNIDWQKFVYSSNLLKMVTTLFKTDILTACLIWKRHSSSIMPLLNEQDLVELLHLIPSKAEAFVVVQWLRHFVSTVGNTHPNLMPLITEWSIQRTRLLQHSENWPEIGLEFTTRVAEIFEELQFLHSDVRRQHERNISKLHELVNALQDLSVLKTSYNLTFTLDNYLQDSIDQAAMYILQGVHLDGLKSLVNDFLYPIFQERGKSPVPAIRRYIALLIANRNTFCSWIPRAVVCIQLLHNEDDRLESALLVLQVAPVPWPDALAPLIKFRFSTHPLALKIKTEYEIQVIKIMKVKYGWPVESSSGANLNLFLFRIIKMDLPTMLEDIQTLTKAAPEIAASANFNCCYHLVRRGKLDIAFEFFKILHADKNSKTSIDIINIFAEMLENSFPLANDGNIEEYDQMIEFYQLISLHTEEKCAKERLFTIKNRFILQQKFSLRIETIHEMLSSQTRLSLLNKGIENIIKRSQKIDYVTDFIVSEICELSRALSFGKLFATKCICERLQCLPLSCTLVYAMLEIVECTVENKDDYVELALVLLSQQISFAKNNFQACFSRKFSKEHDFVAYPLVYEILQQILHFEQRAPEDVIELLKFIQVVGNLYSKNVLNQFYNENKIRINELVKKNLLVVQQEQQQLSSEVKTDEGFSFSEDFNKSFENKPSVKRESVSLFDRIDVKSDKTIKQGTSIDELPVVVFVSHALLLMLLESESTNKIFKRISSYLSNDIKNDIAGARENFFLSFEKLVKAKMHDVWYTIAQYILDYQKHSNCKIINSDLVSLQLRRVFRNVMTHKEVNFIDLFVMLIADNHTTQLLENLNSELKTDQQRINYFTLCEMYRVHFEEKEHIHSIRLTRLKQYYYMEFCKQDPTIKGKFNAELDNIEQLLQEFHSKKLDVHLLERISKDFELDYQDLLITHIISVLRAQELQYEIKMDAFGDDELDMISSVENIRNLCQPYLNEIKNIEVLVSKLKQFIPEINIYFYELYLCVIEILSFIGVAPKEMQVWSSILHFLKHKMIKRRPNRPGQLEADVWLQSQKDMCVLPKIARYRLPFLPIVEHPLKEILDNEITIDNCESWFPLIEMHVILKGSTESGKMRDYFCMSAVRNSISSYKVQQDSETWNLHPTNNAFLKSILRLVQHVQSPSKVFMILYFASNYAPEGADQVEAAYECYKYVMENEASITDAKLNEKLSKIKRKYPILKTQHLLHMYGLMEEKLIRLVEDPTELIMNLYHHEIILKSSKLDINAVATEIAQLHNLVIDDLQFQLLKKWLSFPLDMADGTILDETYFEDQIHANHRVDDASNTAENVVRANYILNSWSKQKAIQFLVAHIFPQDGVTNINKQLQMYECFSRLNDGSPPFNKVLSQRQYIIIKCVHELKQLGYNLSIEKFADCNKIDILKTVWQRNADNPHTLEILAHICLGFDIYMAKIWNGILKRMVIFNMQRELNALVDVLSCNPQLLRIEGLALAWDYVLKCPFKNCNQTRSFKQEEQLGRCLLRLQSCPILHKLKLLELAEQVVRSDRPHMAAILIAFCRNDEERENIKNLVGNRRNDKLRKEILDLEEVGILPIAINFTLTQLELH